MSRRKQFAAQVRRGRERLGLTQAELAKRVRVRDSTVSRWEDAKVFPRLEKLAAIARVLGIEERELCYGD
jgi:transcriptional regulator with XRE-family HTH domain